MRKDIPEQVKGAWKYNSQCRGDKLNNLEYEVFVEVRDIVAGNVNRIQSGVLSHPYIDAICSLATVTPNNSMNLKYEIVIDIKAAGIL